MARFPEAPEGVLSKLRAAMVDEESLSAVARRIGLGELLYLGRGEEASGGREKPSLLADAFEAVIAAVYLHGGLKAVFRVVDRRGAGHGETFVVGVQVGEAVFRSEGRSKKWAEQLGAKAALAAIESWAEAT